LIFQHKRVIKDFLHRWSLIWVLIEQKGDKIVQVFAPISNKSMRLLSYFFFEIFFGFFVFFLVCVERVLEGAHKINNDTGRPSVNFILSNIFKKALRCFV